VESHKSKESGWLKQLAEDMDLEPDEVMVKDDTERRGVTERLSREVALKRDQLRRLLEVRVDMGGGGTWEEVQRRSVSGRSRGDRVRVRGGSGIPSSRDLVGGRSLVVFAT